MDTKSEPAGYPSWIPATDLPRIDLTELIHNDPRVERSRGALEAATGLHVAAYRRGSGGRRNGLCHSYRTASLSASMMETIKREEAAVPEATFVAFHRPLERIRLLADPFDPGSAASSRPRIWMSWSSGKDSYAALRQVWAENRYEVDCAFTSYDPATDQIPMHAVHVDLLKGQIESLGLRSRLVKVDDDGRNIEILALLEDARQNEVRDFAFGDLFLEEVRRFRERKMADTGIGLVFPLWQRPSVPFVIELLESGMRAVISSVDLTKLPASFLGRELTVELVGELEARGCDPCGEHGEYHSFVFDGPLFRHRVAFEAREPVIGKDFASLPLVLPNSALGETAHSTTLSTPTA